MTRIEPKPDGTPDGWRTTGRRWLHTLAQGIDRVPSGVSQLELRLSNLDWVHLFDWTAAAAMIGSRVTAKHIDLEINASSSSPQVGRFLRSTSVDRELARGTTAHVRVVAPNSARDAAHTPDTVLMGLMRIGGDADALQYLDQRRINRWRSAMHERLANAPLLEHEALWRLLCFELAANIAEHAGDIGFLAAHVILPDTFVSRGDYVAAFRETHPEPFLNLCVSDSGRGIITSLDAAYRARHGVADDTPTDPSAVVAFAFHEMGTRKDFLESFITDRHALSRCLHLVEQYGGRLRLRTGGYEFRYDLTTRRPERAPGGLGYLPTEDAINFASSLPGTHIQVLLPLYPHNRYVRPSPLRRVLPSRYTIEDDYPIGHYVPLSCYFGHETHSNAVEFVRSAERLARLITSSRPPDEPLVFDLEDLPWARRHLETFVISLENVISRRATLFLRLSRSLADELADRVVVDWPARRRELCRMMWHRAVIMLADGTSTGQRAALATARLTSASANEIQILAPELMSQAALLHRLCEIWRRLASGDVPLPRLVIFAATDDRDGAFTCDPTATTTRAEDSFRGVHDIWSTVLALDSAENPHVLAYDGPAYAEALTSLTMYPATAADLAARAHLSTARIAAVLARAQPLFEADGSGIWQCCWDDRALQAQARRSVTANFEDVVKLTRAWRGKPPSSTDTPREKYYLPAAHKWLDGFFQSSRILSRERYGDEAAQRLVSSLRALSTNAEWPTSLVATTTPSLLLANAIAHWLELEGHPVFVLDIGAQIFRGEPLPMEMHGWVVIVQDVVSTGRHSAAIASAVRAAGARQLTLVAFVRLLAPNDSGAESSCAETTVALVSTAAPRETHGHLRDEHAYYIEPRTLHPIPSDTFLTPHVSTVTAPTSQEPVDLITWEAQHYDPMRPLIRTGHFIVGHRHHTITINMRALTATELGRRVADEVADICLGSGADDDISMVLMPLDSQVRYLWSRVQERLAQANRRQPFAFLEVASVLGDSPTYLTPRHLMRQSFLAANEKLPRRLLIFDDAVISGATLHQILVTIQFASERVYQKRHQPVVQSVRCYAAVDRLSRAEHRFANNIQTFGSPPFSVRFDSPLALLGPRPFYGDSCPACEELQTVVRVRSSAIGDRSPQVHRWCLEREKQLKPKFIQLDETSSGVSALARPIVVSDDDPLGGLPSADLAITRFQQLMSLSYPVVEVLNRLLAEGKERQAGDAGAADEVEYARYRWDVLSWCLRHWTRFVSFPHVGKEAFVAAVQHEIEAGSEIVPNILAECAQVADAEQAFAILDLAVAAFAKLDAGRLADMREDTFRRAVALETGLLLFFALVRSDSDDAQSRRYEDLVLRRSEADGVVPNRVGLRRVLALISGVAHHNPRLFALQSLAETMCRELAPDFTNPQAHDVLPKLLSRLSQGSRTSPVRHFAAELLSLFISASHTLDLYSGFFTAGHAARTLEEARLLLGELVSGAVELSNVDALAREFQSLNDTFLSEFSERFNVSLAELQRDLEAARTEREASVDIQWDMSEDLATTTLLTDSLRLRNYIANVAIDPSGKHHMRGAAAKISVRRLSSLTGRDQVQLEVTTRFTGTGRRSPGHSDNYEFDRDELRNWGVDVDEVSESSDGALVFVLRVPIGFPKPQPLAGR